MFSCTAQSSCHHLLKIVPCQTTHESRAVRTACRGDSDRWRRIQPRSGNFGNLIHAVLASLSPEHTRLHRIHMLCYSRPRRFVHLTWHLWLHCTCYRSRVAFKSTSPVVVWRDASSLLLGRCFDSSGCRRRLPRIRLGAPVFFYGGTESSHLSFCASLDETRLSLARGRQKTGQTQLDC